jgi:hypothetical protein
MIKLTQLLKEELETEESFTEFSGKRLKGATKIANDAKKKGGPSMLTYQHFSVKLPYYKKAEAGKMDVEKSKDEYQKLIKQLSKAGEDVKMTQIEFQKLVGKIEVLGELIIKSK